MALEGRPFAYADALARDVSRSRTRRSDLESPMHGVRMPHGYTQVKELRVAVGRRCEAYATKMRADHWFSHFTAAILHGLPLPLRFEIRDVVHVSAPAGHRAPRGRNVRGHSTSFGTIVTIGDLRVHDPAETWCELAPFLTVDELIQAGDALLSDFRRPPLCSPERLASAVKDYGDRKESVRLRVALPQLRLRVWSPRESWVRLILLRSGFPEPELNADIFDELGRRVAIGDFVYWRFKVLIEYEGEPHDKPKQSIIDVDRFNELSALGWTIVRIKKHHRPSEISQMVARALSARGWTPGR
ncbi:DUF559 domain-containing protein [Gryllotalpicola koreensis]|uniref:DUF559 domain-containing protein n=1 Tax=Gryllotalpicola koreensis TaxID=993086 RepID=A0ABP8A0K7_9MICO